MMKIHGKAFLCAVAAIAALTTSASAGTIISGAVDPLSPGLGSVSLPVILTLAPGNDNTDDAMSGNNIQVSTKAFEFNDYIDIVFTVTPTVPAPPLVPGTVTEYRVFESVDNDTGIDWSRYNMYLGFGIGDGFELSGDGDGLDFDTPDDDPTPTSSAFTSVARPNEDTLEFSGGIHGTLQQTYEFRVDVPNIGSGIYTFTLRQVPVPVPEPSAILLFGLALAGFGLHRRRG